MPATNTIRWVVLEHVIELVTPGLQGIQIAPGWPGDEADPDLVWAGEIDGDVSIPVMSAGRKYRDDHFTIEWHFRAIDDDLAAAAIRVDSMITAFEDVFADDPSLENFAGLLASEFLQGPSDRAQVPGAGWVVFTMGTASFHARYE